MACNGVQKMTEEQDIADEELALDILRQAKRYKEIQGLYGAEWVTEQAETKLLEDIESGHVPPKVAAIIRAAIAMAEAL